MPKIKENILMHNLSKYLLILLIVSFSTLSFSKAIQLHANVKDIEIPMREEGKDINGRPIYEADYIAADKLQAALKNNNRQAIADLIHYPLARTKPLPSLRTDKEFLIHWDEYFNNANVKTILSAKAEKFGWRGIALSNGILWFHEGRITSINLKTDAYEKVLEHAKQIDSVKLYKTAQGYDKIVLQCSTKQHYIRTQYHGDDLRYFSCKKGADLSTKPELELTSGEFESQGSGGNYTLIFKNDDYTYKLEAGHNLCGEDCTDYLTILKGDKILSRQVCSIA
jgi:hypothetical protein